MSVLVLVLAEAPAGVASTSFRAKDGNYKGILTRGLKKVVYLTVTRNGTKGVARLVCDGQPYGRIHVSISHDGFSGKHQLSPGVQVWILSGHFTSTTTATAHLNANAVCDGKSGNVKLAMI